MIQGFTHTTELEDLYWCGLVSFCYIFRGQLQKIQTIAQTKADND